MVVINNNNKKKSQSHQCNIPVNDIRKLYPFILKRGNVSLIILIVEEGGLRETSILERGRTLHFLGAYKLLLR